jgi:hypothetical protein
VGLLSPWHGAALPQVPVVEDSPEIWRLSANILNKQSRTETKVLSQSLHVWVEAISSPETIHLLQNGI